MVYYNMDFIQKMLPKTYFQRDLVAQEVYIALKHFKSLKPIMDSYVFNDGRTEYLMSLSGTIPVIFEDNRYNIPVCIWLDGLYPQTAPLCYVKPTQDMMTISGNHVDSNGEVMLPYLQDWNQDGCDLVNLLQVMLAAFEEFPPVCSRPSAELAELASCSLQYSRHTEGLCDEDQQLFLTTDDGQPFHQDNETNC